MKQLVEGNKEKAYSRKCFRFYALFNNKGEFVQNPRK